MIQKERTNQSFFAVRVMPVFLLGLLIAALPWTSWSQTLPLGGAETEAEVVPIPKPGDLQPGWWNAVTGVEAEAESRVQELKQVLDTAVLSLSVEDLGDIPQRAELAKDRLDAYVDELKRAPEQRDITVRTDGAFNLTDLFRTADEIRDREIALTDLNENLSGSKDLLARSRSRYDADILRHRAENAGSIGALKTGIIAIADRAELAVLELRDARAEARRKRLEQEPNQYRQQLVVARAALSTAAFDTAELEQQLEPLHVSLRPPHTCLCAVRGQMVAAAHPRPAA